MTSSIFLAGASRGVGQEIARQLVAQNYPVRAMLRSESAREHLEAMNVTVAIGDALQPEAVEQAMLAAPIEVVISTIGGKPTDGERADFKGNRNLVDAAVKAGVKKFILVTSIGSGDSAPALPLPALETLGPVLAEKEQAENHLIASGLTYTIIRPGGLRSEPPVGEGILTENPLIAGTIHRADVAQLVCDCLKSDRANNKILSAVGRTTIFGTPEFEIFSLT
ncbi:SDR family oxidoreductase [Leptothermofonsia sichuanensis E412]|uniref:SDR family oxidoreductase n=1 Tax=Leptothermofonsia sichuanensis TaxID=2917832 RepID=UPI001CA7A02D|nr:SDR family oxidoreductase [Leptothermofonsia sichuanensis]QZZ19037.1 SDR family oxidoreductase [Leptothermofonsia sichuanensis E412]